MKGLSSYVAMLFVVLTNLAGTMSILHWNLQLTVFEKSILVILQFGISGIIAGLVALGEALEKC